MVLTKKCEVEVLVRGAHETIIEGLMKLDGGAITRRSSVESIELWKARCGAFD